MPLSTPPDENAPIAEWAQWYAQQGWPVLPTHTPSLQGCSCSDGSSCTRTGKHPRVSWNAASTHSTTIADWWSKWPDANIQLVTGSAFCVLDLDKRHNGHVTLQALEKQYSILPRTPQVMSGSGSTHYYFALPVGGCITRDGFAKGLDLKGYRGLIVAPPSLHESGEKYRWDMFFSLDGFDLAPLPAWVFDLVQSKHNQNGTAAALEPGSIIPVGERYKHFERLAASLRYNGFTEDQIFGALVIGNANCAEPEEERELRRIAKWAGRKDTAPPHVLHPPSLDVTSRGNSSPPSSVSSEDYQWGKPLPKLVLTDLADMLERHYPLPQWLIKGLIPEGLTFMVGSPKSSKTYLAYSLALSLAYEAQRGGQWLDHYDILTPGPVVYITLEDDEADSRWRVAELAPWITSIPHERFLFAHGFELPRLNEGLVEVLEEQVLKTLHPAMVVLDPISYLYSPAKKSGDQFTEVREMLLPLRWLGKNHHCAIVGVDHRRKKAADDVDIFETTYGSNAKLAIADSILMIVRDDKEITIHARVRKAEDQTLTLGFAFDAQGQARWEWKGAIDGLVGQGQYGNLRQDALQVLAGSPLPLGPKEILALLGIAESKQVLNSLYQVLVRAERSHEVQKTTRGKYLFTGGN